MSRIPYIPAELEPRIRQALQCGRPGCGCRNRKGKVHCPAHDDENPSLGLIARGDRLILTCFAGCDRDRVMEALRARGLLDGLARNALRTRRRRGIYTRRLGCDSVTRCDSRDGDVMGAGPQGLTVAELAKAKGLPEGFLRQLGLRDVKLHGRPAVLIPYLDEDGTEVAVRYRLALTGDQRFKWRKGSAVMPYGLQRLSQARRAGWVLVVEGESDCWTAWYHGLPAIGIPGKTVWKSEWRRYLEGLDVYVWQEPDAADFPRRIARDLPDLKVIVAPDGIKDLSEAHLAKEDVPALMGRLKAAATPVADIPKGELERLRAIAAPVLESDPLPAIEAALRRMGYGGDVRPALITYLCLTTRLLEMRPGAMPAHLLLVGPPSAGKSYTLNLTLRLSPSEAYHIIDAGSPRVLIYEEIDLRHRALIFSEADSLPAGEDNPAASAVRNLLQDHRLHYDVVVRDPETGRFTVAEVDRPGPTVLITTAVRELGGQLGSRLFILPVPEDVAQVRSALETQAELELHGAQEPDPALVALQAYLQRLAPWKVVVPFAEVLAEAIGRSANATRILRDFQRLLSLIKAVTILRHRHRQRRPDGRLVATVEDYAAIYGLVAPMYEATLTGVTDQIRAVVEAVRELRAQGAKRVTYSTVAKVVGLHREQVKRLAKRAIDHDWLVNRAGPHQPADLDVGEPLPTSVGLPTPEELAEALSQPSQPVTACHSVTAQPEDIYPHPTHNEAEGAGLSDEVPDGDGDEELIIPLDDDHRGEDEADDDVPTPEELAETLPTTHNSVTARGAGWGSPPTLEKVRGTSSPPSPHATFTFPKPPEEAVAAKDEWSRHRDGCPTCRDAAFCPTEYGLRQRMMKLHEARHSTLGERQGDDEVEEEEFPL